MLFTFVLIVTTIVCITTTDAEVVHRTEDNEWGLKKPIIIAYYTFESKLTSKMTNYWKNRMQVVSEDHKDIVFAVSDSEQFKSGLNDYGFEFDWKQKLETEPIVIAEDKNETRYLMDITTQLTTDSLQSFVKRFKNKELIPHIKSQPIPDNTGAAVKEVVGKTFKQMVIENPKNVFILMYAHWCGHCKEALPIWQKFGQKLVNDPNVDILQIDVFNNEVPKPFKTMNYPTIYWLFANNKYSPEKYLGERSVSNFVEYVSKMVTKPLSEHERKEEPLRESVQNSEDSEKNEL